MNEQLMSYYYVVTIDGDIFTSSPSLVKVEDELRRFAQMYPHCFKENNIVEIHVYQRERKMRWIKY